MSIIFAFIYLIIAITYAKSTVPSPIVLGYPFQVNLQANSIYTFEGTIAKESIVNTDLIFVVEYPLNDPFQIPFVDLTTSDGFVQYCYSSNNEFSGICRIPKKQLHSNMTINIKLLCYAKCHITLSSTFTNIINSNLGDHLQLTASYNNELSVDIGIQIPL